MNQQTYHNIHILHRASATSPVCIPWSWCEWSMARGGLKIKVEVESDRAPVLISETHVIRLYLPGAIDLLDHNLVLAHATATTR